MSITPEKYNEMAERIKKEIMKTPCSADILKGMITYIIDETTKNTLEYGVSWNLACILVGQFKSIVQDSFQIDIEDNSNTDIADENIVDVLHDYVDKELMTMLSRNIYIEQD
jgi:hypothetical protein